MSKQDIQNINITYLRDYNPEMVALFGSFIRDDSKIIHDIDILVRFHTNFSLLQLIKIENELSDKLGIKVDLVTEGALRNNRIKNNIQKDLKVIYEG
ncbi:MAG: nucleotidyltransferase domain-containing protein [Bacteroidales bacterium]|nr:nucleotidyltransferase domain-containing protein [Bacteroidales bacterium]